MKLTAFILLFLPAFSFAAPNPPTLKLEYSYALDMYCPKSVAPESLSSWQIALIDKIPSYRQELLAKLPWFQSQWDVQGSPLLSTAIIEIGKPFPVQELQAALFLCPRLPFMGTPLSFNVISYLKMSAADIPPLAGQPLPIFFFVSTAFHEVLHKYVDSILAKQPSKILAKLALETDLYKAHLHLFALQKKTFLKLNLGYLLPGIEKLEASHGSDYSRAWKAVHSDDAFFSALIEEMKK